MKISIELARKLRWHHWVFLSAAVLSAAGLVLTGHVSAADMGRWIAGLVR